MFFDELSNDEWAMLAALVSDEPAIRLNRRGRPRAEPRVVTNAILWIMTTGEPWSKLPGRYPSGPTCRRRFEEWQANGTLLEMVRLLSAVGKTFAYVPQPTPPALPKAVLPVPAVVAREEAPRGVSWKSPEAWLAPGAQRAREALDPMGDIARQLSGADEPVDAPARAFDAMHDEPSEPARSSERIDAIEAPTASRYSEPVERLYPPVITRAHASITPLAPVTLDTDAADAVPLVTGLAPRHAQQIADRRGYVIYVAAEAVPRAMYRAWAEIMRDGRRIERSGLVGPRFDRPEDAERFALDWARQWIDRQCRTLAAAASQSNANGHARSLPPMRTVPEPGGALPRTRATGTTQLATASAAASATASGLSANSAPNILHTPARRYYGPQNPPTVQNTASTDDEANGNGATRSPVNAQFASSNYN